MNSLPYNTFLEWSKLKAFADKNVNVVYQQEFFLGWIENILGKGQNASYQNFLVFPQWFQNSSFFRVVKS